MHIQLENVTPYIKLFAHSHSAIIVCLTSTQFEMRGTFVEWEFAGLSGGSGVPSKHTSKSSLAYL